MSNGTIGAGFVKGEKNGNMITPEGNNNGGGSTVEELGSHEDIEQADLDPEDVVIEDLSEGSSKLRERQDGEHVVKVEVDSLAANDRLSTWFSEEEIEELESSEKITEGKSGPETYDEAMARIREDVEAHNRSVAREKMKEEKEEVREFFREDSKYGRSIEELSGEAFQELISEANEGNTGIDPDNNPELEEALRRVEEKYAPILGESDPEIKDPSQSVENLEEATEAWREYDNPVFDELADDVTQSDSETQFESVGPNSRRVTTTEEEMKQALRNPEDESFSGEVELEKDTGETVIAVVSRDE